MIHESLSGGVAQAVKLFVDFGILLDVSVAVRDVRFRLIVIVIADEIMDGVVGKKFFEFFIELGGEGFVVGDNQGWFFYILRRPWPW